MSSPVQFGGLFILKGSLSQIRQLHDELKLRTRDKAMESHSLAIPAGEDGFIVATVTGHNDIQTFDRHITQPLAKKVLGKRSPADLTDAETSQLFINPAYLSQLLERTRQLLQAIRKPAHEIDLNASYPPLDTWDLSDGQLAAYQEAQSRALMDMPVMGHA